MSYKQIITTTPPCYIVGSHWLSLIHRSVYQPQSPSLSHPTPLTPLGVHTFVLYVCVSLSACESVPEQQSLRWRFLFVTYWGGEAVLSGGKEWGKREGAGDK